MHNSYRCTCNVKSGVGSARRIWPMEWTFKHRFVTCAAWRETHSTLSSFVFWIKLVRNIFWLNNENSGQRPTSAKINWGMSRN